MLSWSSSAMSSTTFSNHFIKGYRNSECYPSTWNVNIYTLTVFVSETFFYLQRSLVTRHQRVHASPMVSLKLQYFTPFLRNVSLDRLWFYCAHSYDFCRIYSCINTPYFSRNISYTILFLYQRKGGFSFIFMTTYIPSMITVLSQLASPADIIRGSSRP